MKTIEEKKKQTDPRGKDNNEKQHKLRMKSIYISVWNTNVKFLE